MGSPVRKFNCLLTDDGDTAVAWKKATIDGRQYNQPVFLAPRKAAKAG